MNHINTLIILIFINTPNALLTAALPRISTTHVTKSEERLLEHRCDLHKQHQTITSATNRLAKKGYRQPYVDELLIKTTLDCLRESKQLDELEPRRILLPLSTEPQAQKTMDKLAQVMQKKLNLQEPLAPFRLYRAPRVDIYKKLYDITDKARCYIYNPNIVDLPDREIFVAMKKRKKLDQWLSKCMMTLNKIEHHLTDKVSELHHPYSKL